MVLDAILKDPDVVWLATPDEKVSHVSMLTRVQPEAMPQVKAPRGSMAPVRYFPDRLPVGIHPDGRWILICLITQDAHRDLRGFLERHLLLLAGLPARTLRIAIPAHMATYGTPLVDEVKHALRYRLGGQIADDLQWYFEQRRSGGRPESLLDDDERAYRARLRRFSGIGFSARYTLWLAHGDEAFTKVSAPISHALAEGEGTIEPLVLPHAYSHLAPLVGVA